MRKLTVEEASGLTGVSAERIRQMCRSGEISGEKIAGSWFVSRSAVHYIKNRKERRGRKPKHLSVQAVV